MNRIDWFELDEVRRAIGQAHDYIFDNIITEEVMVRINKESGQTNNRRYMAYRLEHIANQESHYGRNT